LRPYLAFLSGLLALSTTCPSRRVPVQDNDSFRLIILNDDWMSENLGYEADHALSTIKALDISNTLFTISLKEIKHYDWDRQQITLTEDASLSLAQSLEKAGRLTDGAEKLKSLKNSMGWGNPLQSALYTRIFLILLNQEIIYGGIFLDATSQMAINYPVARVLLDDGKAVISLLPIHIPFVNEDPVDAEGNMRRLAVTDEAKADIEALNSNDSFIDKWIGGLATNPVAQEHRKLLNNAKIKEVLKASGKL
jgi:hypothetical protein